MGVSDFSTIHESQQLILANNLATYVGDAQVVNKVLSENFICTGTSNGNPVNLDREQTLAATKITAEMLTYIFRFSQKFEQPNVDQYQIDINQALLFDIKGIPTIGLSKINELWTVNLPYLTAVSSMQEYKNYPVEDNVTEIPQGTWKEHGKLKTLSLAHVTPEVKLAQQMVLRIFLAAYTNHASDISKLVAADLKSFTVMKENGKKVIEKRYNNAESFITEVDLYTVGTQANVELELTFGIPKEQPQNAPVTSVKFRIKNIVNENDQYFIETTEGKQKWTFDVQQQVFTTVQIYARTVTEKKPYSPYSLAKWKCSLL